MSKKKRVDVSKQDDVAIQSPFADLQSLRASLPSVSPSHDAPAKVRHAAGDNDKSSQSPFTMPRAVIRRERAGRGGKTVVKIENTELDPTQLSLLAKAVKKKLGCGATVEDDVVVVLGDLEERVEALLRSEGIQDLVLASKASGRK